MAEHERSFLFFVVCDTVIFIGMWPLIRVYKGLSRAISSYSYVLQPFNPSIFSAHVRTLAFEFYFLASRGPVVLGEHCLRNNRVLEHFETKNKLRKTVARANLCKAAEYDIVRVCRQTFLGTVPTVIALPILTQIF